MQTLQAIEAWKLNQKQQLTDEAFVEIEPDHSNPNTPPFFMIGDAFGFVIYL